MVVSWVFVLRDTFSIKNKSHTYFYQKEYELFLEHLKARPQEIEKTLKLWSLEQQQRNQAMWYLKLHLVNRYLLSTVR
jgi:hypothetical protein